jgi:hypothetical protein
MYDLLLWTGIKKLLPHKEGSTCVQPFVTSSIDFPGNSGKIIEVQR